METYTTENNAVYALLTFQKDTSPVTGEPLNPQDEFTADLKQYWVAGRGFPKIRIMKQHELPGGDNGPGWKLIRTGWDNIEPFLNQGTHISDCDSSLYTAINNMYRNGLTTFCPDYTKEY